jgi:hypothetical protein
MIVQQLLFMSRLESICKPVFREVTLVEHFDYLGLRAWNFRRSRAGRLASGLARLVLQKMANSVMKPQCALVKIQNKNEGEAIEVAEHQARLPGRQV